MTEQTAGKMTAIEFVKMMVRYAELHDEMKQLENQISDYVMDQRETQAVANVQARFTAGRTTYDYEAVKNHFPEPVLDPYIRMRTTTTEKIDWRSVCEDLGFTAPVAIGPIPSVKITVKENG